MERTLRRSRIASEVCKEIKKQGANRVELAAAAEISVDTLGRRLKGDRPFNVDEFVALCHALGVPVAEMLDRAGVK